MHLKYVIIFVNFLQIFSITDGKWCTKTERVLRTKYAMLTGSRIITRRHWYGGSYRDWEPYSYYGTQYYWTTEIKRSCCSGYIEINDDCKAQCKETCWPNSECIQPDVCGCKEGYYYYSLNGNATCKPFCRQSCPEFSECTSPGTCECMSGYESADNESDNKTMICKPICTQKCTANRFCAAPEKCQCKVGYLPFLGRLSEFGCEPVCEQACGEYSYCQEPNKCACVEGYQFDGDYVCQPICSTGCPAFSNCNAPEICECEQGYNMNENHMQCLPDCLDNPCPEHAICYRPHECLCDEGYQMQKLPHGLHCEAECPRNCSLNGKCLQPNICECFEGYELQESSSLTVDPPSVSVCQPKCSNGCTHGICFAPEKCVCNVGYLMGPNNICTPQCSLGCRNGICVEPELCACLPGYQFANNSINICEPVCKPACVNAACEAPDICICLMHYEPSIKGELFDGFDDGAEGDGSGSGDNNMRVFSHICKPTCHHCRNGVCIAPGSCKCWPGFINVIIENNNIGNHSEQTCVPEIETSSSIYSTINEYDVESTSDSGSGSGSGSEADYFTESGSGTETNYFTTSDYENNFVSGSGSQTDNQDNGSGLEFNDGVTTTTHFEDVATTLFPISSKSTAQLLALEICHKRCKCWLPIVDDSSRTSLGTKCSKVCLDDYDEPCFNLNDCVCQLPQFQLICNTSLDSVEEPVSHYRCSIVSPPLILITTSTDKPGNLLHSQAHNKQNMTEISIWLLIGGSLLACAILCTAIYIIWRQLHNNQEVEYVVNYQGN